MSKNPEIEYSKCARCLAISSDPSEDCWVQLKFLEDDSIIEFCDTECLANYFETV